MDIKEEKINLIHWLSKINDTKIINQIKAIQLENEELNIYHLSSDEKRAIEKGLKQIKEGKVKSHEQVMSSIKATFPTLF
jgi:predicted transcriptional regulator